MRLHTSAHRIAANILLGLLWSGIWAGTAFGQAGVYVDPDGVLRQVQGGQRARGDILPEQPISPPSGPIGTSANLRVISLPRLQEELRSHVEAGQPIPDELRVLGGLTRVEYVFADPEDRELLIAGPAEGWHASPDGEIVGQASGMPVVALDDLVVALRSVGPGATSDAIGCSIDPTEEGLARFRQYLQSLPQPKSSRQARAIFAQMKDRLGLQTVSTYGVPPDSHAAWVLVEADYRMKLISLGLEDPGVPHLRDCTALAAELKQFSMGNKLYRWWFTPDYEAIVKSEDGLAFQLRGPGIQLLSEDVFISLQGRTRRSGRADPVAETFAREFTTALPELMRKRPIFAQLRNLTDLAIVAALIRQYRLPEKVGWDPSWLLDPQGYRIATYPVPLQAESLTHSRLLRLGRARYVTGLAGGVTIQPASVLSAGRFVPDQEAHLSRQRRLLFESGASSTWWRDAEETERTR